jgi:hypothetical protein
MYDADELDVGGEFGIGTIIPSTGVVPNTHLDTSGGLVGWVKSLFSGEPEHVRQMRDHHEWWKAAWIKQHWPHWEKAGLWHKVRAVFGDDEAAHQVAFDKAMASDHPAEVQGVADAFAARGFAPQAGLLAQYASSLPIPPHPPRNGGPPVGMKRFRGNPTADMQQWAYGIVHDPNMTYGMTQERTFGHRNVTARVEHHTWSTAQQQHAVGDPNRLVYGAFKGVTLYEPWIGV